MKIGGQSGSATSACRWPSRSPRRGTTWSAWTPTRAWSRPWTRGARTSRTCRTSGCRRSPSASTPTPRYADLATVDAIVIACPTPLTDNREPDLRPLIDAGTSLARVLQAGQLVVLESTTYPGTTRERLVPLLEESGLAAGRDFHVAFSPERVDPGRTDYTLRNTPEGRRRPDRRVPRGARSSSTSEVCDEVVPVSTPEAAELTKLLENIFRSVNIALVNELAILCDRMGIDVWEVVDAAATKPFGFMRSSPARAWAATACRSTRSTSPGGRASSTCRPSSSSWPARSTRACRTSAWTRSRARSTSTPSRSTARAIALLGVSYKPGVGDLRESPALKILRLLREQGADVAYHDDVRARAARPRPRAASGPRTPTGRDRDRPPGARPGAAGARGAAGGRLPRRDPRDRVARTWCACERRDVRRRRRPRLLGPEPRAQLRPRSPDAELPWSATRSEERVERAGGGLPGRARSRPSLDELLADADARRGRDRHRRAVARARWRCGCSRRASTASSRSRWRSRSRRPSRSWPRPRARGRVLMVGHLLEYHPGVEKLKEIVDARRARRRPLRLLEPAQPGQAPRPTRTRSGASAPTTSRCSCSCSPARSRTRCRAVGESYMREGVEDVVFCYLRFPSGLRRAHAPVLARPAQGAPLHGRRLEADGDLRRHGAGAEGDRLRQGLRPGLPRLRRVHHPLGRHVAPADLERGAAADRVPALRRVRARRAPSRAPAASRAARGAGARGAAAVARRASSQRCRAGV